MFTFVVKNVLLLLDTSAQNVQKSGSFGGHCSSLLSCGCRKEALLCPHHTCNQIPFSQRNVQRDDFFFTLLVIFFNPHMAEREARTTTPIHTHILLCVSGQASLFTQGQEKSLRKAKGSLGPLSWLSMALPCHFLSSINVLPRNSSMSLEFWLFFSLGNVPFTEPILRSYVLCKVVWPERSCWSRLSVYPDCFPCSHMQGILAFFLIVGNWAVILHHMYFYIKSHEILILHSLTMSHLPFPILHKGKRGRRHH